jgi:hypothetical protein
MSEISILDVLNANCGDVLKASVLNRLHGFDLNLIALRAPDGAAEKAFAKSRAEMVQPEPNARTAEQVLSDFRKDHAAETPKETLPAMPENVRFEDVEPATKEGPKLVDEPKTLPAGETEIEGERYVTLIRAAELRGTANLKSVMSAACANKWRRVRNPSDGRHPLYLRADVLATATRRKTA